MVHFTSYAQMHYSVIQQDDVCLLVAKEADAAWEHDQLYNGCWAVGVCTQSVLPI